MRILLLVSLLVISLINLNACGETPSAPVSVSQAWVREAPPNATAMAGYMQIKNITDENIILHAASSSAFSSIEFHRSVEKDGVYRMIPHLHLHIAANSTFELKPGDYHLMLFNPVNHLKDGDEISMVLTFSNNQNVEITVPVKKAQY